jgi:DNA invertase Pin-like site-specific DNA recombinase
MNFVFIRHEKRDLGKKNVLHQKETIIEYAYKNSLTINNEFIETFPSSSLSIKDRSEVIKYFQSMTDSDVLIVYDIWVFSLYPEDLVQILSCLLKNGVFIHFAKREFIINSRTSSILVLGLIDEIRKENENSLLTNITGRPKGSLSRSKFDTIKGEIISMLRENITISEMSRKLNIKRSSLNDYIKSRKLREIAFSHQKKSIIVNNNFSRKKLIQNIECPTIDKNKH